jgi:UDP:flavonoid glycosyltransferase YjiC (YdhE family)
MRAPAHDLPLLMLPLHPMVDQPMVARVVAGHGAGLTLPRTASAAAISAAIHRLITETQFRAAAARLGERIHARDGAAATGAYLRDLAQDSRSRARR